MLLLSSKKFHQGALNITFFGDFCRPNVKKLVHFVKFESMSILYSCPLSYCFIFVHEIMLVNK